jgi:hypothetical protein
MARATTQRTPVPYVRSSFEGTAPDFLGVWATGVMGERASLAVTRVG